jgi:hypothetical protein
MISAIFNYASTPETASPDRLPTAMSAMLVAKDAFQQAK